MAPVANQLQATREDAAVLEEGTNAGEVWRAAEDVEYLPVGAEVQLSGNEITSGTRGIAFTESGTPYHIEKVALDDIPSFLERRTPSRPSQVLVEEDRQVPPLCSRTFLLNDPRVGLFHNQRLSYEVALLLARALDRTLVLPGFFKFPHPDAWAGAQWVPVKELFDWGVLQSCYEHVIEIGDLIAECGHEEIRLVATSSFGVGWACCRGFSAHVDAISGESALDQCDAAGAGVGATGGSRREQQQRRERQQRRNVAAAARPCGAGRAHRW